MTRSGVRYIQNALPKREEERLNKKLRGIKPEAPGRERDLAATQDSGVVLAPSSFRWIGVWVVSEGKGAAPQIVPVENSWMWM